MQCLLLGATGRTGQRVLQRLESHGLAVVTYGRRPGGGVRAHTGRLDDLDALRAALDGTDTVVSCLASGNDDAVCSTATRSLIATSAPQTRYVLVSGASVTMPGDRRNAVERVGLGAMRLFMGGMLEDRQTELRLLGDSSLAWTALRPPRLTETPGLGAWRFDDDRVRTPSLSRDDLAGAVVEAIGRADLAGRAPFVSRGDQG